MAEKLIKIGEKEVLFKITGSTPVTYLSMYGKDFLSEFIKLERELNGGEPDFTAFYRMCYVMAKKANAEIPPMEEWLDSFEDGFPVFELIQELLPLIQANFTTQPKKTLKK